MKQTLTTKENSKSRFFSKTHLFECQCVLCLDMIARNEPTDNRRIVIINRYGAIEKFTVSSTARKRKSWMEDDN